MDFFKKKYGPLPVWAWAIIAAVVGYLAYRWYRNRSSSSTSAPAATTDTTPSTGLIPDNSGGAGGLSVPNSTPTEVTGPTTTDFTIPPDTTGTDTTNTTPSPDPSTVAPNPTVTVTPPGPSGAASDTVTALPSESVPATGYQSIEYAPTGQIFTPTYVGSNAPSLEPKPTAANYLPAPSVKTAVTTKSIPTTSSESITAKAIAAQGGVGKKALK